MADAADAIFLKDVVSWGLSGLALILSGGNIIWTNIVAGRLRRASLNREEFNTSIREPIDRGLTEITADIPKLRTLAKSFKGLDQIKNELNELSRAIWEKTEKLSEALQEADESEWAIHEGWAALAQEHLDKFLETTGIAGQKATTHAELKINVEAAATALTKLKRCLRERLRKEAEAHIKSQ